MKVTRPPGRDPARNANSKSQPTNYPLAVAFTSPSDITPASTFPMPS
jgi:hypothetical protein